MRILALVTDGFGADGGIARYNTDLLIALSKSPRVKEVVVLPRFGHGAPPRQTSIIQLGAISSAYYWAARSAQLVITGGFDVVFCGHLNAAPIVARVARLGRKPLWIQVHGIEAWQDRGSEFRRALRRACLVTAVSRYTRKRLLSWSDVNPFDVKVLPNTFDRTYARAANGADHATPKPADLAARHSLEEKKVILTVGRMSSAERYKGHERIIRCLKAVRSAVPQTIYLIVGAGDDQSRLKALANDLGVGDAVIFTGPVPKSEIVEYYSLADVFAMPSTGEGFGIVFLEAAAVGIPVIGGNRDGSLDALADGALGWAVDPEDETTLTKTLILCLISDRPSINNTVNRFCSVNFEHHVNDILQFLKPMSKRTEPPERPCLSVEA